MNPKIYAITAATAAALASGAITTAALTLKAAVPEVKCAEVSAVFSHAQVASSTGLALAQQNCALIDAKFDLTGEDVCTIDDVKMFHVDLNTPAANQATLTTSVCKAGHWEVGDPE